MAINPPTTRKLSAFSLSSAIWALLILGSLRGATAQEAPPTPVEYPGIIEALNSYDVSNLIDGVVTEVHFKPGQFVQAGDILFTIDPGPYELTVTTQRLNTVRAETTLSSARQDLERIQKLKGRGSATDVQMLKAVAALSLGDARLEQAKAELKSAETDLENTLIRARISGIISPSDVNPGAYVEKGGGPLARIDQMDPVRLSYSIPYVDRIEQLAIDDLRSPQELLDTVTLRIKISDTWVYPETTTPDNLSSRVDSSSGAMTVWAELANPNFQLRPGMRVSVQPVINTE